jgi:outer membrane protein TolC
MIYNSSTKKLVSLIVCCLAGLLSLTGCKSPADYKAEADKTVYNIIDKKWQDDFGSKANYKISDTQPSPNDLKVEKAIPTSGILTIQQAVAIATAHNRQYQLEKELLYTMALDLRLSRHEFETTFFGRGEGGYATADGDDGVGAAAAVGFNRLLATGTRISTKVTVAWVEILTGNMRSGLTTLINATITQPLLRGSDSRIVMENLTQAERDTVYQIRSFNRFRQTFVVSVISQYYLVLQQLDFLKNAENNHKILIDIYGQTEKLVNAGRLPRYELDRVRQDKLNAQDIYIQAEKDYKQALDEFKISLSLPATAEFKLDENELTALSIPVLSKPDFSKIREVGKEQTKEELTTEALDLLAEERKLIALIQPGEDDHNQDERRTQDTYAQLKKIHQQVLDELKITPGSPDDTKLQSNQVKNVFSETDVIETALALRLDLANKADAIDDAERKVFVAADGLGADLNLTAAAGIPSRNLSTSKIKEIPDIFITGLELNLPLDRVAEQNVYRKALITLTQCERGYEEATNIVVLEVRQAYRDLTESAERHRVQLESLELAKKRFNNTLLLLQYGRVNSRRVLDAQADLFSAQNAATDALVGHTVAMLNFYRDAGVLQVRPDGMWEY